MISRTRFVLTNKLPGLLLVEWNNRQQGEVPETSQDLAHPAWLRYRRDTGTGMEGGSGTSYYLRGNVMHFLHADQQPDLGKSASGRYPLLLQWAEHISILSTRWGMDDIVRILFPDFLFQERALSEGPQAMKYHIHGFLITNLHRRPTLPTLAAFLGCSRNTCSRMVRIHLGEPFQAYLKRLRLNRARPLLEDPTIPVTVISQLIGFTDKNYFSRFVKKWTGRTPQDLRIDLEETVYARNSLRENPAKGGHPNHTRSHYDVQIASQNQGTEHTRNMAEPFTAHKRKEDVFPKSFLPRPCTTPYENDVPAKAANPY